MKGKIAKVLLDIGAVGLTPDNPIRFKSGLLSPVYVDNRKLPFHPEAWKKVIGGWVELIKKNEIDFEIVAGIESAGIPHSAALGYVLGKPSVFCRKKVKDHGTKKLIEGGDVSGKRVLLIEDLVTTGSSSLAGVDALRSEKAEVEDCLVVVSYGFDEARQNFESKKVKVHPLTDFPTILQVAVDQGRLSIKQRKSTEDWLADPWGWERVFVEGTTAL